MRFSEGLKTYMSAYASDVRRRSMRDFAKHWRRGSGGSSTVTRASKLHLKQNSRSRGVLDLMIAAVDIPRHEGALSAVLTRAELVTALGGGCHGRLKKSVKCWTTYDEAAREFLTPQAPFKPPMCTRGNSVGACRISEGRFCRSNTRRTEAALGLRHMFQSTGHLATSV